MSLRDDISTVADVVDILAYEQRAEMLANQTSQLAALRDIRDQAQVQALEATRQKSLQDTLFALRRSLPLIAKTAEEAPHKAASDVILADQTLRLVPPEAFTSLEWKELSVLVRAELEKLVGDLQEKYGETMTRELIELRDAALAVAAEERSRNVQAKRAYVAAFKRRQAREETENNILIRFTIIAVLFAVFGVLGLLLFLIFR